MLVEVCANSLESALNAERAGADRLELCTELGVGGITPSLGLLQSVREQLSIPVRVLIRPRSGDFTYSAQEFEIMKKDIAFCKTLDLSGIVSGMLRKDLSLDTERTQALIELSAPLEFTFHRAFDWVPDPLGTLGELEDLGVNCVLSSGQEKTALEGISLLSKLQGTAKKTIVMPGGGVRENNVLRFKEKGFKAIHLSATAFHTKLEQPPKISMNSPSFLREDAVAVTKMETVRHIVDLVK
ncbi:copper homeostasis protein CutC [Spongiimicrobium sp. 2-473A-2-J]|uniref:copper homeostasis protein CutC n=1 Tax=Eudoraea algarum TaxID=3417568 RepID=UPI003D36D260